MNRRRTVIFFFILALIFFLPAGAGFAATVKDLYSAQVPVYGLSSHARGEAMREALAEVLVKVSGSAAVLNHEQVRKVLKKASAYAQQFQLVSYRPGRFFQLRDSRPRKILAVSFDAAAVDRILQSASLPQWGHSRPSAIVWLMVDYKGKRQLVDNQGRDLARDIIQFAGARRGMPLILPLMDLKDQAKVKTGDIAGGFFDRVRDASRRYETEAIIIGKVTGLANGRWDTRWTLIHDGRPQSWDGSEKDMESAIIAGIGQATDRISSVYAQVVDVSRAGTILVRIDEVKSMRDYARVGRYLQSLAPVRNVLPVLMEKDHVLFQVQYQGSDEGLKKTIQLGTVLVPAAQPPLRRELPPGAAIPPDTIDTRAQAPADVLLPGISYRLLP